MLHISADKMIRKKDLLMIIDLQKEPEEETKRFLDELRKKNSVYHCKNEKSVVIVTKEERVEAYYSPISALTLLKRSNEKTLLEENERVPNGKQSGKDL